MVRGGRCGERGPGREARDIENEDLRRQVQQLAERLERFETRSYRDDELLSEDDINLFGQPNDKFNDINMNVDIPKFEGRIKLDEFIDWYEEKGSESLKLAHGKKMKKELRKKFLPENYIQEWYSKLYNFQQGGKSVVYTIFRASYIWALGLVFGPHTKAHTL
ncbi:hypothetical protein FF2_031608 [Malus domestica]